MELALQAALVGLDDLEGEVAGDPRVVLLHVAHCGILAIHPLDGCMMFSQTVHPRSVGLTNIDGLPAFIQAVGAGNLVRQISLPAASWLLQACLA